MSSDGTLSREIDWRGRFNVVGAEPCILALFSAQVISLLGSGVTTVGLTLYVYEIAGTASASIVLGQALMLRILAFLIFSQPAGILADRVNRKAMLITADLGRVALVACFPLSRPLGTSTVWYSP